MGTTLCGQFVTIKENQFILLDLPACVMQADDLNQKVLLRLDSPILVNDVTYSHAVISPRLAKDSIDNLLRNGMLGCAVTWIPETRFDLNKPFDISWWRGGGAAITDVRLRP